MTQETARPSPVPSTSKGELPSILDTDDGDRPSITETNGTVVRFEMAFDPNPKDRFAFHAPFSQRVPSFVFLGFASALGLFVVMGTHASSNSAMFRWVTEHPASVPGSMILFICALGVVIRAALRGVIVTRDAIETRDLVASLPRVRRWRWAQIDRVIIDDESVMLELWNGSYERLPRVQETHELGTLLERIAASRGRPVTRLKKLPG